MLPFMLNRTYNFKYILKNLKISELKKIKNKKFLLLGSNGFLGRAFVEFFLEFEKSTPPQKKINFKLDCYDLSKNLDKNTRCVYFYKSNVLHKNIKKKYDYIIYLAGLASPEIYKKHPIETLEASYEGLKKFLYKAKKDASKIIFFSSSEIYGNPDNKNVPTKESYYGYVNSFGPRACYDEGKRVGETLCYIFNDKFKTNIKIIRPFNVYGPNMPPSDNRVIPKMLKTVYKKGLLEVYSNGKQTRSFCYINDAMVGFLKVILDDSKKIIFNVGNNNQEITIFELAKIIKEILNKKFNKTIKIKKITYPSYYPSDEPLRRCPDLKLLKKLGYKPQIGIKNGLEKFIRNYKIK